MPHPSVAPHLRHNARRMRRKMTDAELKLWNAVRAHRLMGLGFRRQMPVGPYVVDFACPQHRMVVEIDGSQHADDDGLANDRRRTRYLEGQGWCVLRFWNDDVLKHLDNVCLTILAHTPLLSAPLTSSRARGEVGASGASAPDMGRRGDFEPAAEMSSKAARQA